MCIGRLVQSQVRGRGFTWNIFVTSVELDVYQAWGVNSRYISTCAFICTTYHIKAIRHKGTRVKP